jgi:hypothetical protein
MIKTTVGTVVASKDRLKLTVAALFRDQHQLSVASRSLQLNSPKVNHSLVQLFARFLKKHRDSSNNFILAVADAVAV